jgi:hypothetical protein
VAIPASRGWQRESPRLGWLASGQVNTTGNARQGRHFDLVVKDGRIFHNYGDEASVYEVGPAVSRHTLGPHEGLRGDPEDAIVVTRSTWRAGGRPLAFLRAGVPGFPPGSPRSAVQPPRQARHLRCPNGEPKVKGRKKLKSRQFVAKNGWKF